LKQSPRTAARRTRDVVETPLPAPNAPDVLAWEMIETGRYMPRRIRGSFPGRELG